MSPAAPPSRLAVLGGTFDHLHVGHEALLRTAFAAGDRVAIGVTTARYLRAHAKPRAATIQPYGRRVAGLRRWLGHAGVAGRARIVPLEDAFGGSLAPGVGVLVVSAETARGGRAVNAERRRRGVPPVPVVVVPLVLADDLRPVSSRRIRSGEIDPRGRRRTAVTVGVAVERAEDLRAAIAGVRSAFARARVLGGVGRGGSGAPSTRAGRLAERALRGAELGLGVAGRGRRRTVVWRSGDVRLAPRSIGAQSGPILTRAVRDFVAPARSQRL